MKRKQLRRKRLLLLAVFLMIGVILFITKCSSDEEPKISSSKEAVFLESKQPTEQIDLHQDEQFAGIEELLKDSRLAGTTTAISIRRASDGEVVYAHEGDTRVRPASVMKLFTAAAALENLGASHTFETKIYTDGKIKEGVLEGNLYVQGGGDPTLGEADLNSLAIAVKEKGIHTIQGNIYGDDFRYDDIRLSQDLNWSDEPYYTGAQVSALNFSPNDDYDAGTVMIEVYPGAKEGEVGRLRMIPENNYVQLVNETTTVQKKGDKVIEAERLHGGNTIVVKGTIPMGNQQSKVWASIWEPTDFTLHLFEEALKQQEIVVSPERELGRQQLPKKATLLAEKSSMPLADLLIPFMKLSNNGHGEVLVKEMGQVKKNEGSWAEGLHVLGQTMADFDLNADTLLFRDGSGMSHKALVTANEVTQLLYVVQSKNWYPTFQHALPVAGNDERFVGGTLRYRMTNTVAAEKVRAKTGTLNGVASLAGYVEKEGGEDLIFSVIINNHLDESVYELIDHFAIMLAGDEVD